MDSPSNVTVKVIGLDEQPNTAQVSPDDAPLPLETFESADPEPVDLSSSIKLFDGELAHETGFKRMKRTKGSEDNVAMHALLKLLDSKGEVRALKCLPRAWHEILEKLESDFPNFVEVIDYLRGQFSLSGSDASVISFDSFLLDGPPGVGKSYFAEELGRRLEVPFRAIRMENAQSNAQLVGSDEFWSNSRAGAPPAVGGRRGSRAGHDAGSANDWPPNRARG